MEVSADLFSGILHRIPLDSVTGRRDDADVEEVVWVTQVFAQPLDGRLQQGLDAVNHNLESLWLVWNEWDGEKTTQLGFKGSPVEVMSDVNK